jgi:hypothetical protein
MACTLRRGPAGGLFWLEDVRRTVVAWHAHIVHMVQC